MANATRDQLTRHEAAGENAAEGYASAICGRRAAFATSDPGFTNAYASLANAKVDRVPLSMIPSSPRQCRRLADVAKPIPLTEQGRLDLPDAFARRLPPSQAQHGYDLFANRHDDAFRIAFGARR